MNDIVKVEKLEVATVADQSAGMLTLLEKVACNPEFDVSKLEQILDAQERVLNRAALISYNRDMSSLQSVMPIIPKNGEIKVGDVVRSKYAKFEDIVATIKPYLADHGFSVGFKVDMSDGFVRVKGIISHREGHSENTTMTFPNDTSGSKNAVQAIASSISYAKRYALSALLNIASAGEDDDGNSAASNELISRAEYDMAVAGGLKLKNHMIAMRDNFDTIVTIKTAIANEDWELARGAWEDLIDRSLIEPHALQITIYSVAPKNGGIWTTDERKMLHNSFADKIKEVNVKASDDTSEKGRDILIGDNASEDK